jgi:O-antigen ligase
VAISGIAIDVDVSGTATPEGLGRYLSFVLRLLNYLAVTVVLLFLGNTTERDLPRARVIAWTCWLGVSCVLLGLLALVLPDGQFPTLATRVLPGGLLDDGASVARLAQVQPVLGDASPRPAGPFSYTNAWGHTLALLLVWLVAWWGAVGGGVRRWALAVVLCAGAWPIVFSLNRGMWLGLGLAVVIVAVRLALRGRLRALVAVLLATSIGAVGFVSSPLQDVVTARLDAQHSNDVRGSLLRTALDSASQSPVVGFGTTRRTLGSGASIAVGPSEACPRCGSRTIGSTGQVTLLLISQGFLGALLYFAFLGAAVWRFARDHSVLGLAGTTVVTLEIFFAFFYSALTVPLLITFLSIGLLWRNDQIRREVAST